MSDIQFFEVSDKGDLERCYPVFKELRTGLSFGDFVQIYAQASSNEGYRIVGLRLDDTVVAVMGFRILHDYAHGKHLYIDDLVSTESQRSKGLGAQLLAYAEKLAEEQGCTGLRLCTGIENERGKRFYEKHNWNLRAVVYKKKLPLVTSQNATIPE